eukprot:TRINITY_DN11683_c0_g1_i1.p1 TRINITY_DN11683_c0_g1~~TRINITY_DN11683_c0_g1_i1.p1  ORF type:complete len:494 (-),score=111.80 TRINITY_DN11683_c0_g1_i1:91-1572(-)
MERITITRPGTISRPNSISRPQSVAREWYSDKDVLSLDKTRETLTRSIDELCSKNDEFQKKINRTNAKIQEKMAQMGQYEHFFSKGSGKYQRLGCVGAAEMNKKLLKRKTEGLEKQIQETCAIVNREFAKNQEIKTRINDLRREKVIFKRLNDDLETKLNDLRNQIDVNENSSEESSLGIQRIKNEMELLKMDVTNINYETLREYEGLDGMFRQDDEYEEEDIKRGILTLEEEVLLKKRVRSNSVAISKSNNELQQSRCEIAKYKQTWKKISDETGVRSIEDLVQEFMELEGKNYSRVTLSNELSVEIEGMEQSVNSLRNEQAFINQQERKRLQQRAAINERIKRDLDTTRQQIDQTQHQYEENVRQLKLMMEPLETMFSKIGCSKMLNRPRSERDLLFKSPEVMNGNISMDNLLEFMGIIELRSRELIQLSSSVSKRMPPQIPMNHQRTSVMDWSLLNEENLNLTVPDDDDKPLSGNDLRRLTRKMTLKDNY